MNKYTNYEKVTSKDRKLGQSITLVIAFLCFFSAAVCVCVGIYFGMESTQTPAFASMLAMTVFFICVGFLLYVLGSGNLPNLQIEDFPDKKIDLNEV
ncbi:MAG: hemerythrin family protein [Pseudomonadota bacterium]